MKQLSNSFVEILVGIYKETPTFSRKAGDFGRCFTMNQKDLEIHFSQGFQEAAIRLKAIVRPRSCDIIIYRLLEI